MNKMDKMLADLMELSRQREAEKQVMLPEWLDSKRGTPNSFLRSALFAAIQGRYRTFLREAILASQKGITVKFTGEQLNQEDLTVWEALVHTAKAHPLGHLCEFSAYSLLRALGLHTGLSQHKQLHSTIVRLTACAVEITHDSRTYTGSLIESSCKDEITSHYVIRLNRDLIKLFGDAHWTAMDWRQRLALRNKPLAQALHAFYSSHREPYPLKTETLRALVGSQNSNPYSFKDKLKKALEDLVRIGFIKKYTIDERGNVSVERRQANTASEIEERSP